MRENSLFFLGQLLTLTPIMNQLTYCQFLIDGTDKRVSSFYYLITHYSILGSGVVRDLEFHCDLIR